MKATQSLQSCARCTLSPRISSRLLISSTYQRSTIHDAARSTLRGQARQLCSTAPRPQGSASSNSRPPRKNNNNNNSSSHAMRSQLLDLIRETRAPEPKRKETVASRWDQLLGTARNQNNAAAHPSSVSSNNQNNALSSSSSSTLLSDLHEDIYSSSLPPITLRLRPTLGRTIDGIYGDPTRGFRLLERKCHDNNVKADMRSQEKHVRRGQRRKNVRILRWRKLFMEGFRSELGRIRKMRKQGW